MAKSKHTAPAAHSPSTSAATGRYPTLEQFLRAVDDQRVKLLNVLGSLQCVRLAVSEKPPIELEGAVALLEDEVQRVVTGLDVNVLVPAAARLQLPRKAQS